MHNSIRIHTWESLSWAAQQSSAGSQILRTCLPQLNSSLIKREGEKRTGQGISRDTYVDILVTKLCEAGIHHCIGCASTS